MNIFSKAIDDMFNVPEFFEFCEIDGEKIKCVAQSIDYAEVITEYGYDEGISFNLCIKKNDISPKKGKKIKFRDEEYKIDRYTLDCYGLTYTIYLKSISSK